MPLPAALENLLSRSHELVTLRHPDWPHQLTLCARNGRLFAVIEYAGENGWDVLTPIVDANESEATIKALEKYTTAREG